MTIWQLVDDQLSLLKRCFSEGLDGHALLLEELDHLGVEKQLRHEAGVSRATANPAGGSVTVEYDPAQTDGTRLQSLIKSCGFRCRGGIMPKHVCKPAEANLSESGTGPGRGADSRGEQAVHHDHRQGGAKDEMAQEMGHGAGMDMQEMVRDMRNRFWIAFIFTIPIFIYSPMGGFFTPPAPPFGMNLELFLFGLASAAVLYPVWPFVVAAWRALRNGILNMAVLVVLSVGTGYLFSVGSTFFFPGVQFYEAVAILLVFGVGGVDGHRREQVDEPGYLLIVADDAAPAFPQVVRVHPGVGCGADRGVVEFVPLAEDLGEEAFLGAEVVEEAGLAQPDRLGEVFDRGAAEPLPGDHVERTLEDLLPFGHALGVGTSSCHEESKPNNA